MGRGQQDRLGLGVGSQRLTQRCVGRDRSRRGLTGSAGVGLSAERCGLGDHVDDHGGGPRVGVGAGEAVGAPAPTGELFAPGGQGPQCVGAALGQGAWIVIADLVGHLGEFAIQDGRVGGQ